MPQLLGSKTIVQEEAPSGLSFPSFPTAVLGAAFVTERGPLGLGPRLRSFEDFAKHYGGHIANSDAAALVQAYFDNGGTELWVSRVVHYTDPATPATKTSAPGTLTLLTASIAAGSGYVTGSVVGPFVLSPNDTLVVDTDAISPTTATFTATSAARENSNNENYALSNNQTLTVSIDGGSVQTVTFLTAEFTSIGAATAEEVAAVINAKITGAKATATTGGTRVTITSDRKGSSSAVNVTGGTANAVLGFTTGTTTGTGNVANIAAVTVAEVKTVVEAAVTGVTVSNVGGAVRITRNTTGASATVQVDASATADTIMGLDNAVHPGTSSGTLNTLQVNGRTDGTYANVLRCKISAATSGDADRFNLDVLNASGVVLETFANLSMTDTDGRYVETILNAEIDAGGSRYFTVVDLDAATTSPNDIPNLGTFGPLTGGNDGLAGLVDADWNGSGAGKTGIRAFDEVEDLTLLAVPGIATSSVQNAMITYAEVTRGGQVLAVLDTPANQSETQVVTYVTTTAALKGLSEYAAFYWPRVKITNPSTAIYGTAATITVPPSMLVAGMMARTDGARDGGVYDPPAGMEVGRLFGVLGLERKVISGDGQCDYVFPKLINPIVTSGGAHFVDGARTLRDTGNFPYVHQRRGSSYIERIAKGAVDPRRHRNNTTRLRMELQRGLFEFLAGQTRKQAFASEDPTKAFFVDFGDALNPPSQKNTIVGRIGLAWADPAEFIVLKFGRKLLA